MDGPNQSKVDMSLDDIIKLSKKEKRKATQQSRGRGRGSARGRGGNFSGRGRGRGQVTGAQMKRGNMQGVNRNTRGRGAISRGRGSRGRGAQRQHVTASPLNRQTTSLKTVSGKGRGRGRGQQNSQTSRMYTNSNQVQPTTLLDQRRQRLKLNGAKAQASLLRRKQMALRNLQTAKKTMQDINKALQKTSRANVVDQRRGIVPTNGSVHVGGPGKRKLLTGLMRQDFKGSNLSLASNTSGRQMVNTSVTITNQAATRKRRQWRPQNTDVTVQVSNPRGNMPSPPKPSNIIGQLKLLKPTVSTTYKFQKNVFASSSTTVSLNDRFSSSQSSLSDNALTEGRKVFI